MVAESGVNEGGAVESVDDVGVVGEEALTDGERFVESSFADEAEDGIGEVVEVVEAVVVESDPVLYRRGRTCDGLALGEAADLELLAAAAGAGSVSGRGHEVDDAVGGG